MIRAYYDFFRYAFKSEGRTGRKGFLLTAPLYMILWFVLIIFIAVTPLIPQSLRSHSLFQPAFLILTVLTMIPLACVFLRRYHDMEYNEQQLHLWKTMPIIGHGLILMMLFFYPSVENNRHGPTPLDGYTTMPDSIRPSQPSKKKKAKSGNNQIYEDLIKDKPPYQQ